MVGDLVEMRKEGERSQAVLRKIFRSWGCETLEFGEAYGTSPAGKGPWIPRKSQLDGTSCPGSVVLYVLLLISTVSSI